ncbi:unnamed protein product [marine sediment metagenome]|uniref:Uncharacterized protein n=1 Tax=marine sediment metagenome TaxID=412755 RepID=X1MH21_9ZZZZ
MKISINPLTGKPVDKKDPLKILYIHTKRGRSPYIITHIRQPDPGSIINFELLSATPGTRQTSL